MERSVLLFFPSYRSIEAVPPLALPALAPVLERQGYCGWHTSQAPAQTLAALYVGWLEPEWSSFDVRKDPRTPWLRKEHVERIMDFERVLNARYPTISGIRLKSRQVATLKALGSRRYFTRFYKAPYEIRFVANRLFKYRQPEVEGF
jgi:hypothetical protein